MILFWFFLEMSVLVMTSSSTPISCLRDSASSGGAKYCRSRMHLICSQGDGIWK